MKYPFVLRNAGILLAVAILCVVSGQGFLRMHQKDPIATTNPAISEIRMLSDYSPKLKGTALDTEIYVLRGKKPGGSMLILGGTHPNEIAGVLNAVTFVERATVEEGTLYVIPRANNSGFTHTAPLVANMDVVSFQLTDGSIREFRVGDRRTNPIHQWPDPNYYDGKSGRMLKNGEITEVRNLNRNYPGDPNGNLTEQACYGIANLIQTEKIDITFDAHEANPGFPRVNYLIAHENAVSVASSAIMGANIEGFPFELDLSSKTSFGLSHRSLGDNTSTLATLFETLNPAQGSLHGKMTRQLVVDGKDANYVKNSKEANLVSGQLSEDGSSINQRVGYHMAICQQLAIAYTESFPNKPIVISSLPTYDQLTTQGIESVLQTIH